MVLLMGLWQWKSNTSSDESSRVDMQKCAENEQSAREETIK